MDKYPIRPFRLLEQAGEIAIFFYFTLRASLLSMRASYRKRAQGAFWQQVYRMGVESLPLIIITGAFTGMVLSAQTFDQLHKLGADTLVGPIVGVGMVESLGPILTALMMSSRVGGSIAAELGTMKVTEQVDALRVFGADPMLHLVAPRFMACVLVTPLLTLMADLVGMIGGFVISTQFYNIDAHFYVDQTKNFMGEWQIFCGLFKSVFFGAIIGLFCCWRGLATGRGAEGVGRATTHANVLSAIGILVANFFITIFLANFYKLFIL
jgi:phospholipid/cholesterol/gamma-HCH transport system permease protein